MPTQIVPPPVQVDQNITYWPGPRRQGTFAAMADNGSLQFDSPIDARLVTGQGGTTGARVFPVGTGTLCVEIGNAGAGISSIVPTNTVGAHPLTLVDASLNAALIGPEYLRVTIHRYWFRVFGAGVGTISDQTCVGLWRPEAGAAGGIPTAGNTGFGLVGDGVGNLRYANYRAGAFPANRTETVALPVGVITSLAEWNQAEWMVINSAPGRDATMSLRVNGTDIVTRNWNGATGATLADYSTVGGGLGSTMMGVAMFVDETGNPNVGIQMTSYQQIRGRYDWDGVEILT